MSNHTHFLQLVDTSIGACIETPKEEASAGDWPAVLMFFASQFEGLRLLAEQGKHARAQQTLASCRRLLADLSVALVARPAGAVLTSFSAGLAALQTAIGEILGAASTASAGAASTAWPMRLPELVFTFVFPLIALLQGRCQATKAPSEAEDVRLRGLVWVATSMWRIHSGGGALVPGGLDHCEAAAELKKEFERRSAICGQELAARACEALVVDAERPGEGIGGGIAREMHLEAECWTEEAKRLEQNCRLRPPLAHEATPSTLLVGLPAVVAVSKQGSPSYSDLCQEVTAFATTVATKEKVLRIVPQLTDDLHNHETVAATALGMSQLSELQNLTMSSLNFVKRLQARFPLHGDLVSPMVLSIHGLVHGLHLVHRQSWLEDKVSEAREVRLEALPQCPTYEGKSPSDFLGQGTDENKPDTACWWLRWAGVVRMQEPRPLLKPRPKAALRILQRLSQRHFDEEEEKAKEEVQQESLFKMAKAAAEAEPDQKEADEETAKALFPAPDEEAVNELLGLNVDFTGGGDAMEDDDGNEGGGGGGLYDLFSMPSAKKQKTAANAAGPDPDEERPLSEKEVYEICDLSMLAFVHEASAEDIDRASLADAVREEALDASLEMFIRRSVTDSKQDQAPGKTAMLSPQLAARLSPLVLLRLRRAAAQLKVSGGSVASDETGNKVRAAERATRSKQKKLHTDAVCSFYSDSNPSLLLQLAAPLRALLSRTKDLLSQFEEHPSLVAVEGIVEKMLDLKLLQTTPMAMVTMLEVLLGRVSVWEEAACREVSMSAQLRPLESILVNLRERQLFEWKDLRQARKQHIERQGGKWWLHVVGVMADATEARKLVDELMRFLRISPLAQFRFRLRMLKAAAHLYLEAEGESSLAGRVATHVHHYAGKWLPITDKVLKQKEELMEKEIKDLVKIVRWDMSNYHALKDSVSRSHRQIAGVIKRFDEGLSEIVDKTVEQASSAPEMIRTSTQPRAVPPEQNTEVYLISEAEQSRLGPVSAERFTDQEDFWSDAGRVVQAAPMMLKSLVKIVGDNFLQDTFCFAAPEGYRPLDAGEALIEEMKAVQSVLQDEELNLQVKRRRLQVLREELARVGIVPRPMTKDAFDVSELFSSTVKSPLAADSEELSVDEKPPLRDEEGPPRKRCRRKTKDPSWLPASQLTLDTDVDAGGMRRRLEDLTYDIIHLALRVHSIKEPPPDMTAAEVNQWMGIASACIHAVKVHKDRCDSFQNALSAYSVQTGTTMQGPSVSVDCGILKGVFADLDRLLEGCCQARLIATSAGGQQQLAKSVDSVITSLRSLLLLVHKSDEFKGRSSEDWDASASTLSRKMRVRLTFVQVLLDRCREVAELLTAALDSPGSGILECTKDSLRRLDSSLGVHLEALRVASGSGAADEDETFSWKPLRAILLSVQKSRNLLKLDNSISISAAEKALTPAGEEEKEEADVAEKGLAPKLGLGKTREMMPLLDILPLHRLNETLAEHVKELPEGRLEVPFAPFAMQTVYLGRALMLCGLESNLATLEVSVELLKLVAYMLERGLGTKTTEDDGEADDGPGKNEWASGTGMGEGEGMKDVTEEIEDDQQLDGLEGEKQEKQEPEKQEDGEEDKAREMGFDFDGEFQNQPQQDQGDGEKDKEQEDLDRKKDDVDLNDGGQLEDKLWNGEDDDDDKGNDDDNKKDEKQKENIEAHGAEGDGEAEVVPAEENAPEEKERTDPSQKDEKEKKDDKKDKEEQDDEKKDKPEPEEGTREETEFDREKDAQFDVNMQPDDSPKEGEGDGEGEGEHGDELGDMPEDGDLDLEGADGEQAQDGDDDGSDGADEKQEEEVDESIIPKQPEPEGEGDEKPDDQNVDACIEGEGAQPEENEQEENKGEGMNQQPASGENNKSDEPECKGEPSASKGQDTNPQSAKSEEQLFGGSSGQSTNFESQKEQDADGADAKTGADQGGMAPTNSAKDSPQEMPSDKPQQQKPGAGGDKQAPQPQEKDVQGDAAERRLQKVDILREADEGEVSGGKEEDKEAEKGLHLADPQSGADALGECKDPTGADNQAIGAAEQEGEEEGDAMAADEEEEAEKKDEQKKGQELSSMAMQQSMEDAGMLEAQPQATEDGEKQPDAMQIDGVAGTADVTNVAKANLPLLQDGGAGDAGAGADEEKEDIAVGPRPKRRSEREARQLWNWLEQTTTPLAAALCEQLRTILEPTLKGRLQGHYRTGKRISMRKVIPFIASNYRRDKIWLRRTKPSKREYQVLVSIDNSRSMAECGVGPMALQTLSVICQSLAQLEVGEYGVLAFGSEEPRVLLPLGAGQKHAATFGWEQAGPLLQEFTFREESVQSHNRSLADMMKLGSQLFDERSGASPSKPFSQVSIIISDGRFNKGKVRPWVHQALSRQQLPLLVIVDGVAGSQPLAEGGQSDAAARSARRSVFDLKAVSYENGQCNVVPYLQDFPFPYYVVVQDLKALPSILSDVLKQWFELAGAA
eukprot:TRINITY_DN36078_c0_g1_i1.p1 TRINITY_DN36078_c0_g1~~TRINITY_DN36078_c0_g1_i1.p1  ORF type:complete len:2895 (-),score=849.48 TRINITY_DN36078_c0_g1_i1:56-7465(-)